MVFTHGAWLNLPQTQRATARSQLHRGRMTQSNPLIRPRPGSGAIAGAVLVLSCLCGPSLAQENAACGDFKSGYGPFDYRTASLKDKEIVERHHFTADVENLRRGESGTLGGDLSYTLRAFPNHPRALLSMMKLGEKAKTEQPRGAAYTVECFFERATRFAPDDGTARLLAGIYLSKKGRKQEAIKQLEIAQELAGQDANIHYNLGLAYFDLKNYEKALLHAQKAYALGFPLPGLRDKLKGAGKWREG